MSEISKLEQSLIIKKIDSTTVNIQITNNEMLMTIVGEFNQNLKELGKLTNTNIFFRGNSITCKGKEANLKDFSDMLEQINDLTLLAGIANRRKVLNAPELKRYSDEQRKLILSRKYELQRKIKK